MKTMPAPVRFRQRVSSTTEELSMNERKRPRVGPGEIFVLLIIGLLVLAILTERFRAIFEWLYSPYAGVLVVVMVVEYLLLKGSDRSAIYRRERDAAREVRRDDMLAMREMETHAVDLRARLGSALDRDQDAAELRRQLEHARTVTDDLIQILRDRIKGRFFVE
jgi:hypothetical protein